MSVLDAAAEAARRAGENLDKYLVDFFGSPEAARRWAFRYELEHRVEYHTDGGTVRAEATTRVVPRVEDWTSPYRIPTGWARFRPLPGEDPRPEFIQANLFTLAQIGGGYDLIALRVEADHLALLTRWRLDSKAPRALDYIRARSVPHNEREDHA